MADAQQTSADARERHVTTNDVHRRRHERSARVTTDSTRIVRGLVVDRLPVPRSPS